MPQGFYIGKLFIHFYGIIIMSGAVLAAYLAARQAKQFDQDPEHVWDMMPWLLILGIIGARLWHIFTPPPSQVAAGIDTMYYLTHPLEAINIRAGGLGIFGAVLGGLLGLILYTRKRKLNLFRWMDIIAPGLVLAQGIGRWGNFINQELYGMPTDLPWKIFIEPQYRLAGYQDVAYYHPLFLYEFLWNVAAAGFLLWISKRFIKSLKPGDVFLTYMILYPIARFLLDFIRLDASTVGGININQTVMGVVALAAAVLLVLRHTIWNKSRTVEEETVEANITE